MSGAKKKSSSAVSSSMGQLIAFFRRRPPRGYPAAFTKKKKQIQRGEGKKPECQISLPIDWNVACVVHCIRSNDG